jgi:hypothetical protein
VSQGSHFLRSHLHDAPLFGLLGLLGLLAWGCADRTPEITTREDATTATDSIYRAVLPHLADDPSAPERIIVLNKVCEDPVDSQWTSTCNVQLSQVAHLSLLGETLEQRYRDMVCIA